MPVNQPRLEAFGRLLSRQGLRHDVQYILSKHVSMSRLKPERLRFCKHNRHAYITYLHEFLMIFQHVSLLSLFLSLCFHLFAAVLFAMANLRYPPPMFSLPFILLVFFHTTTASSLLFHNSNPLRSRDHNDPHLICSPTKWTDIVVFFFGNYFAHAATIKSLPGEGKLSTVGTVVGALLFPASGVVRGLTAILTLSVFAGTDLETAARAGALCMVVRSKTWRPPAREETYKDALVKVAARPNGVDAGIALHFTTDSQRQTSLNRY